MAASKRQEIARPQSVARAGTRLNADTSSQPQGITRRVMLNILEAFFRRPVLHLLPLALMLALGVAFVVSGDKEYSSVGTLSVTNESLLADLTNSASTPGLTFETPATLRANQINELLRTDEFLSNVVAAAGLTPLVEGGVLTGQQLRSSVGASADGNNLVRVSATSQDPELSFRLADGTITSYREWLIEADVSKGTSTEESLQQRLTERQTASQAADQAVRDKILEQPEVPMEDRSIVDQLDFERLQEAATRAADQLREAQDALDLARTQTEQASAIVAQRVQLLDEPEPASAPAGRLRAAALTMIVFGVVGVMLSLATVVLSASLDHTIRVPNDVTARFGVDVLAVVPDFKH